MSAADSAWYRDAFRQRYLDLYRHRSPEAARDEIERLAGRLDWRAGEEVLDLCCGAGRHSAALRALGMRVTGLDLSLDLLREQLRQHPGVPIALGDMRSLPFAGESFDLVVQLFTSFGYFENVDEDQAVLGEVGRILRPGGRHVLDLMNRERVLANLVPHSRERTGGRRIEQWRVYEPRTGRIVKRIEMEDANGEVERWVESVRVFAPRDITARLEVAGLNVEALLGSFAGETFDERTSERLILVARKTA